MTLRSAYLIGNQSYRNDSGFPQLRGPIADVTELARILGSAQYGQFTVFEFIDQPHHVILPVLENAFTTAARDDLILIFYAGHGQASISGRLHLATADTCERMIQTTSIPAWILHNLIHDSNCRQVILLLDCCYSGRIGLGFRGNINDDLRSIQSETSGLYILTASNSLERAVEMESRHNGQVMGQFTSAIVVGIESGEADQDGDGKILLSDLKRHLEKTVRGQTPQLFIQAGYGDPLISFCDARYSKPDLQQLSDLLANFLSSIDKYRRFEESAQLTDWLNRCPSQTLTTFTVLEPLNAVVQHLVEYNNLPRIRGSSYLADKWLAQTGLRSTVSAMHANLSKVLEHEDDA